MTEVRERKGPNMGGGTSIHPADLKSSAAENKRKLAAAASRNRPKGKK